ncbi:hypothetical protein B0A48_06129 [Cryoendolithus antarcticus]|uniref:ferroxidase n=1 Tax=Cryoendolithus antarcticus TaxID=1507870 RepID=A0A1V8TA72_9PEZI|nr:hypothetical protein B0A48_06129 [Cryoendolithus antarcticus]
MCSHLTEHDELDGGYGYHYVTSNGLCEDPAPPPEIKEEIPTTPTEIDEDTYHMHADQFMESVHEKAEAVQEGREDVEVEYSAGVLSINFPPNGTYILNKQPPNKQIWLSSPISGPKRFDWLVVGESQSEKEGAGTGNWVYLRDGTTLSDVLRKELAITVDIDGSEENLQKKSIDFAE